MGLIRIKIQKILNVPRKNFRESTPRRVTIGFLFTNAIVKLWLPADNFIISIQKDSVTFQTKLYIFHHSFEYFLYYSIVFYNIWLKKLICVSRTNYKCGTFFLYDWYQYYCQVTSIFISGNHMRDKVNKDMPWFILHLLDNINETNDFFFLCFVPKGIFIYLFSC